jgi:hypothetical protein
VRLSTAILLVLLCACGGNGGGGTGGGDASGGGQGGGSGGGTAGPGGGTAAVLGTRFDTQVTTWPVPGGGDPNDGFYAPGSSVWLTIDIDGDHRPDLVWTRLDTSSKVWGAGTSPYWRVFRNNGSGFASTDTQWAVPMGGDPNDGFYFVSSDAWGLFDINGDGRPDLVWTRLDSSSKVWGSGASPFWRVFLNTGSGFAATDVQWPVPQGGDTNDGFYAPGTSTWLTYDLDGDHLPDLVWTRLDTSSKVWGFGSAPYWQVFKNTGSAFASDATHWSVPQGGDTNDGFYAPATSEWSLPDLDGDGRPDLVWSRLDSSSKVWGFGASAYWQVFKNTGSGFEATATQWAVPSGGDTNDGFYAPGGATWETLDIDGDHRPDLIWTRLDSSSKVWGFGSAPYWQVYRNVGTGFAAQAQNWSVPGGGDPNDGFYALSGSGWGFLDLNGDGRSDLVWTRLDASSAVWDFGSSPSWHVFLNVP